MIYYCSQECHDKDQVRHRSECIPSVLLDGASSIASRVYLSSACQDFEQKSLLRRGAAKEPPAVLGTREITVDPRNFVTVRLVIDGRKHTSLYLSTDLDIRFRVANANDRWDPPATLDLYPSDTNNMVLIAPGENMVADLERRRAAAKGGRPRPITLPDEDLINFAQSIPPEHEKDKRQVLGYVVEWYEWGTMVRENARLV